MRRTLLVMITVGGIAIPLIAGTALAIADDSDDRARSRAGGGLVIEIDPELDAAFGPRPVNAVQAAAIVGRRFAGARVTEAELDERDGGPIWEMTFLLGNGEREVEVDAVTGTVLGGGDDDLRGGPGDDDGGVGRTGIIDDDDD